MGNLILTEFLYWLRTLNFRKRVTVPILMMWITDFATFSIIILLADSIDQWSWTKSTRLEIFRNEIILIPLIDIIGKVYLFGAPGIPPRQYVLLPISRKQLIRYTQIKHLTGSPNAYYAPVLVFIIVIAVYPGYGFLISLLFFLGIALVLFIDSLLAYYLREKLQSGRKEGVIAGLIILLMIILLILLIKHHDAVFVRNYLQSIVRHSGLSIVLCFFTFFLLLKLNTKQIGESLYLAYDEKLRSPFRLRFFKTFTSKFKLVNLVIDELFLIVRNKRTRQFLFANIVMTFFLLFYYKEISGPENATGFFLGYMILSPSFAITNYLQMSFGWQSKYFEGILTKPIDVKDLFNAKIILFDLYCVLIFMISLPLFINDGKFLIISTTALLCNLGLTAYILTFFTFFNNRSIDLRRSTVMNYEGIKSIQVISGLLMLSIPIILYKFYEYLLDNGKLGLLAVGLTCILSICCHGYYIHFLRGYFPKRKYRILHGFKSL